MSNIIKELRELLEMSCDDHNEKVDSWLALSNDEFNELFEKEMVPLLGEYVRLHGDAKNFDNKHALYLTAFLSFMDNIHEDHHRFFEHSEKKVDNHLNLDKINTIENLFDNLFESDQLDKEQTVKLKNELNKLKFLTELLNSIK